MITLEQVKQLEAKVARAIEYVERISGENSQLQGKLDSYQRRIDELEVLIQKFREDQGRIEEGILSALDRLNKFEDAIEKSIASPPPEPGPPPHRESREPERKKETPAPASVPPAAAPVSGTAGEIETLEPEGAEDTEESPFEDSQDGSATGELDIF
ncbi:MAG: cell division protein ZapB [Treponema sp.]|jgi:FtsZ-binding cell division protein ZapB|nr:cell division protein ZapB [Treponema sp.]